MIKIPELLMPAGGPEQLKAAVANGADAVYMSGSMFNARVNARNFTDAEIAEAIEFAHLHGTKIHITQNTLVKNNEIESALEHAVRMYELGADALILQDRGLASLIKKVIPDMPLHLSTQGTAYDVSGVLSAAEAGFSRVILSRELSLEEIRAIKKVSPVEIETFVHGAICICYSGQCHMSDFIGGRSGNRGACAQPCRLPYELMEADFRGKAQSLAGAGERFPLSPADMNLVAHLRELAEAGVDSIKIEGRMKSPEYVATVSSVYRKYLDMINTVSTPVEVEKNDIIRLKQMFNRGDFTDAYLMGRSDQSLMSEDIPKHKGIKIGRVVDVDKKRGHAVIKLSSDLANGDGIEIRSGSEACGNVITYIKETSLKKNNAAQNNQKGRKNAPGKKPAPLKNDGGAIVKAAAAGMTVTVGDIPALISARADFRGADVYKITDKKLMKEAAESYNKVPQKIDVEFVFSAARDEYGTLTATVNEGDNTFYATASSQQPFERAVNKPADEESLKQRLAKTGGTPYRVSQCFVELSGGPAVSAAEINNMRRAVLDDITEQRIQAGVPEAAFVSAARTRIADTAKWSGVMPGGKEKIADNGIDATAGFAESKTKQVSLFFYDQYDCEERVGEYLDYFGENRPEDVDLVFTVPVRLAEKMAPAIAAAGLKASICMPAITKDWNESKLAGTASMLEGLYKAGMITGVYAANHGHAHTFAKYDIPVFFDEGMNIYNLHSITEGVRAGMQSAVLSHELGSDELMEFIPAAECCEITVGGRIPLMYMEHCPVGSGKWAGYSGEPCTAEKKRHHCRRGDFVLRDRKNEKFPVIADDSCCRAMVISHIPLLAENYKECINSSFGKFRIYICNESPESVDLRTFGR